jgi:hypothetical protein
VWSRARREDVRVGQAPRRRGQGHTGCLAGMPCRKLGGAWEERGSLTGAEHTTPSYHQASLLSGIHSVAVPRRLVARTALPEETKAVLDSNLREWQR